MLLPFQPPYKVDTLYCYRPLYSWEKQGTERWGNLPNVTQSLDFNLHRQASIVNTWENKNSACSRTGHLSEMQKCRLCTIKCTVLGLVERSGSWSWSGLPASMLRCLSCPDNDGMHTTREHLPQKRRNLIYSEKGPSGKHKGDRLDRVKMETGRPLRALL